MNPKLFWLVTAILLVSFHQAEAQQPKKVPRIGFLGLPSASSFGKQMEALRAGLRDLGYLEGKNILIDYRWAEGNYDRLSDLAGELVRLRVDILVTHGTPGTIAAKRATTTIPIIMRPAPMPWLRALSKASRDREATSPAFPL